MQAWSKLWASTYRREGENKFSCLHHILVFTQILKGGSDGNLQIALLCALFPPIIMLAGRLISEIFKDTFAFSAIQTAQVRDWSFNHCNSEQRGCPEVLSTDDRCAANGDGGGWSVQGQGHQRVLPSVFWSGNQLCLRSVGNIGWSWVCPGQCLVSSHLNAVCSCLSNIFCI